MTALLPSTAANTPAYAGALRPNLSAYDEIVVVNAEQPEAAALLAALRTEDAPRARLVCLPDNHPDSHTQYGADPGSKTLFVLFKNRSMSSGDVAKQVHHFEKYVVNHPANRLLYVSESYIDDFPMDAYFEVSEEEYAYLVQRSPVGSAARDDYRLDERCAELFAAGGNITVIRYNNLFGPLLPTTNTASAVCLDASRTGTIRFTQSDRAVRRSYSFVDDLLSLIATLSAKKATSCTYNLASYVANDFDIKMALAMALPGLDLEFPDSLPPAEPTCSILQGLRARRLAGLPSETLQDALAHTYDSLLRGQAA